MFFGPFTVARCASLSCAGLRVSPKQLRDLRGDGLAELQGHMGPCVFCGHQESAEDGDRSKLNDAI